MKIIIIGPAHPLRGGLASYDERLARQFLLEGHDASIYTFSLQYPGFLFPGTTQYSSAPAPPDLKIHVLINSVNPLNWIQIGRKLKNEHADIVIVRYWLPFMGPCLGTILRIGKKNRKTRIICIADNIIPHEKRPGDTAFTKYFVQAIDGFITMSEKVLKDVKRYSNNPVKYVPHPLYDNFGEKISPSGAREKLRIGQDKFVVLFFGFIRKYKGLDLLLQAMPQLIKQIPNIVLLIAGEFYQDATDYDAYLNDDKLKPFLALHTDFIADSEVRNYFCAADLVIQPYRNATQSGVTPLAYHFEIPMVVTNVGGLPAMVQHGQTGFIAEPNVHSIAKNVVDFYHADRHYIISNIQREKQQYGWQNITGAILEMAKI